MPSALVPLLETNAGTGAVPVPLKSASASVMFSIVTLPVLVTVNVYSMVFPSADSTPVLAKDSDGSAGTLTTVGTPGSPGVPGLSTSGVDGTRSEEHTSELQSIMRTAYAVFWLKKNNEQKNKLTKTYYT